MKALFPLLALLLADSSGPPPGGFVVRGTVRTTAPIPRKKVRMDADPKAAALHSGAVYGPDTEIDAEGRVRWALVYVKSGLEGRKYPVPKEEKLLLHEGAFFKPFVFGIQAGQGLRIRNEDDLLHNTHSLPLLNKEFNFGQPVKGHQELKRFEEPELVIKLKCDIHPWESSWAGVFPHPHFAVTGADGAFEMPGLPPGEYVLEAWHPRYEPVTQAIRVKTRYRVTADFTFTTRK